MKQLVYVIADLDELFGFKPQSQKKGGSWWAHHWKRMVADAGFPAPLPGFFTPRWAVTAVRAWIAVHGGALPLAEQLTGGEVVPFNPQPAAAPEIEPNLAALERAG